MPDVDERDSGEPEPTENEPADDREVAPPPIDPGAWGALGLAPTVAGLSFVVLALELLIARTSVFYINAGTSYVAIPLTLLGLSIGSLALHLRRERALARFDLSRALVGVGVATLLSCVGLFVLFSRFPIIAVYDQEHLTLLLGKTLGFVALLLVPLALAGRTMAAIFTLERQRIGQLYAADLAGAAVGAMATPLLLHFVDLPVVVAVALVVLGLLVVRQMPGRQRWAALGATIVLASGAWLLMTTMEGSYNLRSVRSRRYGNEVRELAHRWNEYSRVAVIEVRDSARNRTRYQIIHDNAESNVNIGRYQTEGRRELGFWYELTDIPFRIDRDVDDALVMFAGCGMQMIQLNEYSRGEARIRGVELNPLVVQLAVSTPELRDFRIGEFLRLPNIDLRVQEGRAFMQRDRRRYDFIYAGSDAGTSLYRSGHSRKFLDTVEAMADYVAHLRPSGILAFEVQPVVHKINALRVLFERLTREERARDEPEFDRRIIVLGPPRAPNVNAENNNLLYSPRGFSPEDVAAIQRATSKRFRVLYGPGYSGNHHEFVALIEGPPPRPEELVTDDRPFLNRITWEGFELLPDRAQLAFGPYYRNWVRIVTLMLVSALVVLLLVVAFVGSRARPSPLIVVHLLLSGFAYMLCQIPFMGMLELFLGNPLVAMAVLLSLFLFMNGLGSYLFSKVGPRLDARLLCALMLAVVPLTLVATKLSVGAFLGWPLVAKLGLSLLLLAPLALCLGLFYPFAVSWLTSRGRDAAVPITFGLSTLSSVLGGTWALFAAVNYGYSGVVTQAVVAYGVLALVYLVAGRARSRLAA
jgi:hypothetical protein